MGIAEKEGRLHVLDTDIPDFFFFSPTAEITARFPGKISAHIPTPGCVCVKGKQKKMDSYK